MPKTRAQQNRAIRQEALRDQLASQGHLQHVVDIAGKLREPDDDTNVSALKAAADIHMRLIDKYLPAIKAVELTGEGGGPIPFSEVVRTIVDPSNPDS